MSTLLICAYIVACTLYFCHAAMDDIDFVLKWASENGVWAIPVAVLAALLLPVLWLLTYLRKALEWIAWRLPE